MSHFVARCHTHIVVGCHMPLSVETVLWLDAFHLRAAPVCSAPWILFAVWGRLIFLWSVLLVRATLSEFGPLPTVSLS